MTRGFDPINLGAIAPPDVVEPLDFETILAARTEQMQTLLADVLPDWDPTLESDPTVKHLEEASYREVLLRQRINDAARAVLLATAQGQDLDHIAASYHLTRHVIDPGTPDTIPPRPPVMESDPALKERILLAFEALSVAGPEGAYVFHARSAHPLVLNARATSPKPGTVLVSVMARTADGLPTPEVLEAVQLHLTSPNIRPLTDHVTVAAATRLPYRVHVALQLYSGPDAAVVVRNAEESVRAFTQAQRRFAEPVTLDGVHKAARVEGVRRVTVTKGDATTPFVAIEPPETGFADCTHLTVQVED